jgi:DNA-directed RNA polymerase subunit RPC12/RpoP
MQVPPAIDCPDCGGKASLLSFLPEDEDVAPGTPIAYRCADCLERFDVVMGEEDEPD